MPFVPMSELLMPARSGGYAVPSFCVWDAATMQAVLRSACALEAPVILMSGPSEFALTPPQQMAGIAGVLQGHFPAKAALHLDHGDSFELVEACLAAGYTSVMLDYSTRPYEENAAALRHVVAMAGPLGVSVEGEIGVVGRAADETVEGSGRAMLTDPGEAARYVADTGVDALAVSIGNAHGIYTQLPRLDFERLAELRDAVPVPLVLHGGSGTPEADLRRAISLGIAKVNVASELVKTVRESLMAQWQSGQHLWAPMALATSMSAMAAVVERWLRVTGGAGQAR